MDNTAVLERAYSLTNEAMHTVALQFRRLKTVEPEDDTFVFRWWADLQFLILALCRLRRSAKVACNVSDIALEIKTALHKFDLAIPHLTKLRNIGEHIDEYAVDSDIRHDKTVNRKSLQVGTWDGAVYEWLDIKLDIETALTASEELYRSLQEARKRFLSNKVEKS